jgi:isopenicillin N synthase-like dioxygenase
MHTAVPVIDVAPFLGGSAVGRRGVSAQVGRACADVGFFSIVGHDVPADLVATMVQASRAFFDLPLEEKLQVERPKPEQSRGYVGVGDEHLAYSRGDAGATDLKEFFAIGPIDVPDEEYYRRREAYPSFAPNVWPERPADFRDAWTRYYRAMESLAGGVMRMFALALELPDDFFRDKTDRHISGLRVLNYPAQPSAPLPGQLRAGPHTDYGAVTILTSDGAAGGLEVQNRRGEWMAVASEPDAFVLNIGDLMQRWTNDRWTSTLHRVVNPPRAAALGSRRQSIVFFHQPNYDAVVECLPSCCGRGNPPRYPPVTSGEHRLAKFLKGVGAVPPLGAPLPTAR